MGQGFDAIGVSARDVAAKADNGGSAPARIQGSTLPELAASRILPPTENTWAGLFDAGEAISPPYDPWTLVCAVDESQTLSSRVEAYATNLTGFGYDLEPLFPLADDAGQPIPPPDDAAAEKARALLFLESCHQGGISALAAMVDTDIEGQGNGYIEVLRNARGDVAALNHIQAFTLRLAPLSAPVKVEIPFRDPTTGEIVKVPRLQRFRRYVQIVDNRRVWFKELGDPRPMDANTGKYLDKAAGDGTDATEIVHLRIYHPAGAYGVPRWLPAASFSRAGREAIDTVLSWFLDAPIGLKVAMIAGGAWNADSYRKFLGEVDSRGRGSRNAFTVVALEADASTARDPMDETTRETAPKFALEDVAFALPPELFKGDDSLIRQCSKQIDEAFRLPPIYWGGSEDYSRAAANTARAVAEEQVFVPLRKSRWGDLINGRLFPALGINRWAVKFRGASTSDDAEILKALTPIVQGGGLAPNALIRAANELLGQKQALIAEPWGERPLSLTIALLTMGADPNAPLADVIAVAEAKRAEAAAVAEAAAQAATNAPTGPEAEVAIAAKAAAEEAVGIALDVIRQGRALVAKMEAAAAEAPEGNA